MKKILTAVLCLAVPGLFFLNAWQGFRSSTLSDRIDALERQQRDLLAANRDIIGQIAYETSPQQVARKAAGLGLTPIDPSREIRLLARPSSTGSTSAQDAAEQNVTEYRDRQNVTEYRDRQNVTEYRDRGPAQ